MYFNLGIASELQTKCDNEAQLKQVAQKTVQDFREPNLGGLDALYRRQAIQDVFMSFGLLSKAFRWQ
eukprot:6002496-Amphidinium_carterae.1